MNRFFIVPALAIITLAACGGGGGGGGGGSAVTPGGGGTITPTPTPSPATIITGTVTDITSSAPLAGFTVTVGTAPAAGSCNGTQTQTINACAQVAAVGGTATTASDGTFSVTVPAGTYMVTIGKDVTYATLHRTYTATAGASVLGSVKLTAINTTLQAWLADVNSQRATVSVPASFANMTVDEYAQEQAVKWSSAVALGTTVYGDAQYAPYQAAYAANPGAMYAAAGVLAVQSPPNPGAGFAGESLETVDTGWMSEKNSSAGPGGTTVGCGAQGGNWQTCYAANPPGSAGLPYVGHYYNISNTQDVFVGLGTTTTNNATLGGFPTNIMIVTNTGSVGPANHAREPVAQ